MNEFTHSHDRHVDRVPTHVGYTGLGTVLGRNVSRGIQVGMQGEPALSALEHGARTAVVLCCVSTARALLRGMPGINPDHRTTAFFGFVLDELFDLSKGPSVDPPLGFGVPFCFNPSSNVGQVFQNDGPSRGGCSDDLFGEDVVTVATEPFLGLADLLEVAFRALGSSGLQSSLQLEQSVFDGPPSLLPEKLVVGCDGRLGKPEIYSNDSIDRIDCRRGDGDRNVHEPSVISFDQIGSVYTTPDVLTRMRGYFESDRLTASGSGQAHSSRCPIDLEGVHVVARGTAGGVRTRDFFAPALEDQCTPNCLGCLYTGLDVQITHECGILDLERAVELVVEADPILFGVLPASCTDGVEHLGKQGTGFYEGRDLPRCRFKCNDDCTPHSQIIPYAFLKVNNKEGWVVILLSTKAGRSSHRIAVEGLLEA